MRIIFGITLLLQFAGTHYPVYDSHPTIPMLDKVLHFSAFVLLTVLFRANWARMSLWRVLLLAGAYGAFDEITQLLAIGRSADPFDWCADFMGAGIGFHLFNFLKSRGLIIRLTT